MTGTESAALAAAMVSTTATAAEIATSAATTAAAVILAGRSIFFRARLIHDEIAAFEGLAVERFDGLLALIGCAHGDECEAARASGHAILDEVDISDSSVRGKVVLQNILRGLEGEIANVEFHFLTGYFYRTSRHSDAGLLARRELKDRCFDGMALTVCDVCKDFV